MKNSLVISLIGTLFASSTAFAEPKSAVENNTEGELNTMAAFGRWEFGRAGHVPADSFVDRDLRDTSSRQLYICRVDSVEGTLPGKLLRNGECLVSHGGVEWGFPRYEVLQGSFSDYAWVDHVGRIPSNAILAGDDNGVPMYLCTSFLFGEWMPGRFHPGYDKCFIPYGGDEHDFRETYLLVER